MRYQALLEVLQSLVSSTYPQQQWVEETDVSRIVNNYRLHSVPAITYGGKVIFELNNHIPSMQELKDTIDPFLNQPTQVLVPTDFSANALNAVYYALDLAKASDYQVKLFHATHPAYPMSMYAGFEDMEAYEEKANASMNKLILSLESAYPDLKITGEVQLGLALEAIIDRAQKTDIQMLIMGTTGHSSLAEQIFGSISSRVAQQVNTPLMLIPPGISFQPYQNIMVAMEQGTDTPELLSTVGAIANRFNALIHQVHVENPKPTAKPQRVLLANAGWGNLDFSEETVINESVPQGLKEYTNNHPVDMICLSVKSRGLLERFVHKSVTKQMVLSADHPLLIFHE